MGIAALVLGIISIIVALIPFCGAIAFVPAIIGLILGIVDIVNKKKADQPKGMAIAGTVLCGLAILFIILWLFVISAGAAVVSEDPNFVNSILSNAINYQMTINSTL